MDRAELERLLRKWGQVFGEKAPSEWDEDRSGYTHPIARVSEHAPGGEDKRVATARGGESRLRLIGEMAGLQAVRGNKVVQLPAPAWSAEPIHAEETRGGYRRMDVDLEAEAVDLAWLALHRADRMQGVILRLEYCARGKQVEKAFRCGAILNLKVKLRRYRLELDYARAWMRGHMSGKAAA